MHTDVLDKLLFAGNMTENAKIERNMQWVMDRVSQALDNSDRTINAKKTEILTSQYLESRTVNRPSHHCECTKTASC